MNTLFVVLAVVAFLIVFFFVVSFIVDIMTPNERDFDDD